MEALQKEFQKNNINVNLDSKTGALTLDASVLFDVEESELTDAGKESTPKRTFRIYCKVLMEVLIRIILLRSLLTVIQIQMVIMRIIWSFPSNVHLQWHSIFLIFRGSF